jgi:hypothetical protein
VPPETTKTSAAPSQKLPAKVVEASVRPSRVPGNKVLPTVLSVPLAKPIRTERQAKNGTTRDRKDRT